MSVAMVFLERHPKADLVMKKSILLRSLVMSCLVFSVFPAEVQAQDGAGNFSAEVTAVLDKKIQLLQDELARDPLVIQTVQTYNEQNKGLREDEIMRLDKEWSEEQGLNEFMKGLLFNPCSKRLAEFQEKYDGFAEIFVTDAQGLNVGLTNKTSDYYQADEDWWVRAFADGRGHLYYGALEYDESAMSESIPVYLPIMDSQTQKAIGALKAVVDITVLKMEL